MVFFFFFQAEDGIRDLIVTGVQTCALPIWGGEWPGCGRCGQFRWRRRSRAREPRAAEIGLLPATLEVGNILRYPGQARASSHFAPFCIGEVYGGRLGALQRNTEVD